MERLSQLLMVLCACCFLQFGVVSCQSLPDGTSAPPAPFETKILARSMVSGGFLLADTKEKDLMKFKEVVVLMKEAALLSISDPTGEPNVPGEEIFMGLNPIYAGIAYDLMELTLLRIRPLIDTEDPDLMLAMEYANAVFDGATQGIDRVLLFKRQS